MRSNARVDFSSAPDMAALQNLHDRFRLLTGSARTAGMTNFARPDQGRIDPRTALAGGAVSPGYVAGSTRIMCRLDETY